MFNSYTSPFSAIPAQMISYKEKIANNKKIAKETFDAYENLGRKSYLRNMSMLENYQMLNGQFLSQHYYDTGNKVTGDLLSALTEEFEIPSTLRHYDIIGKVVNNLTEKLAEFPDVFRVEEKYEEDENNEYVRTQTDLMRNTLKSEIYQEIDAKLRAMGVDPNRSEFADEEEAAKYQEEVQQMQQAMQPSQIQKYMNTEWQSQGEIWAMHQLEIDKERHRTFELERVEFRDMLAVSRCYRHYYLTGNSWAQETWNPINTFAHESPEVEWTQNGDYVGRIFYLSKAQIIDRYGWKMKKKDIKTLEELDKDTPSGLDATGFPYKVYAPFEDFKAYELTKKHTGYDPFNNIPTMGAELDYAFNPRLPHMDRQAGLYRVTQLYYMSQKKIGKVVYIDPETGLKAIDMVDENFVVPNGFKELYGDHYKGDSINTVYWTYVNQVWQGTKICYALSESEAIYLDLEPVEFQFKGDDNIYGAQLPVCGRVFNRRNATAMSLVDMMKPHQIGHNVCMNQLYQLLEKEIGKFMIWDANFFNTMKDWGGEESWDKIALIAKELGHVFGDTSPQAMKGGNPGNQMPREANMELTAQMFSRAKLAEFFEARAMAQLGVTPQIMGDVKSTDTATGINTAVSQSSLNVQRFYTDFFEYKQRCLTMALDIAQYTQATDKDITLMYTKSDASRVFVKMNGTGMMLRDIHVYVVNSQQLLKQLETIKNYFVNTNTLDINGLDIVEVISSNSPSAIKAKLKETIERTENKAQQQAQQEQQRIDQQKEIAMAAMEREDGRVADTNDTKKEVAYINTFARQPDNQQDANQSGVPDSLEYEKFNQQVQSANDSVSVQRDSNRIKEKAATFNNSLKEKELKIKEEELKVKKLKYKTELRVAKENKNPGEK